MKLGLFKFKYGEEVIAEYEEGPDSYFVKNTASLMPTENMHWHLVTWMPYTDVKNGIHLPKSEIWFVTKLSADMEDYYFKWKEALKNIIKQDAKPVLN